jgi:hypothetical protein
VNGSQIITSLVSGLAVLLVAWEVRGLVSVARQIGQNTADIKALAASVRSLTEWANGHDAAHGSRLKRLADQPPQRLCWGSVLWRSGWHLWQRAMADPKSRRRVRGSHSPHHGGLYGSRLPACGHSLAMCPVSPHS